MGHWEGVQVNAADSHICKNLIPRGEAMTIEAGLVVGVCHVIKTSN